MGHNEALQLAVAFIENSRGDGEPPLSVDTERVRESGGLLIVPYNSAQYLASRDERRRLLDRWPILVDLHTGQVRFGRLEERHLWRSRSA